MNSYKNLGGFVTLIDFGNPLNFTNATNTLNTIINAKNYTCFSTTSVVLDVLIYQ